MAGTWTGRLGTLAVGVALAVGTTAGAASGARAASPASPLGGASAAVPAGAASAVGPAGPQLGPPREVRGAPVDPTPRTLVQPDGSTFEAVQHGDAVRHWWTADGATIARSADGTWRFATGLDASGQPAAKGARVSLGAALPDAAVGLLPVEDSAVPQTDPAMPAAGFIGEQKTLVLLAQFTNRTSVTTPAQWNARFFGAADSVRAFYRGASSNTLDLTPATETSGTANDGVVGWVTLPIAHPNYYNAIGASAQDVTARAIVAADPFIDFASYDTSGNGAIEPAELHLTVIAAGFEGSYGGSSSCSPRVWGHRWALNSGAPVVDGITVGRGGYTQFGELHSTTCTPGAAPLATIGIMAHEFGHDLGWPDLYDTDSSSSGVGNWSLMAAGSWGTKPRSSTSGDAPVLPDAWSRSVQGWVTPVEVGATTNLSLSQVSTADTVVRLLPDPNGPLTWSSGSGEYFLVENRQKAGLDTALPGCGLVVYHVHEGRSSNANDADRLVDVVEADGLEGLNKSSYRGGPGDAWHGVAGHTVLGSVTTPNTRLNAGTATTAAMTAPGGCASTMTATLTGATTTPPPDTAAPALAAFDFSPRSVDVSAGPADVVVTARVTDATGALAPTLTLFSDETVEKLKAGAMTRVSGTATDGTYQRTVSLPVTAATGPWTVYLDPLTDTVGNTDGTSHSHPQRLTVARATTPGAPTTVTAVAGNGQASVSWAAPVDDGGAAITGYTVTASPSGNTCTTTSALTCTVTGLSNGTGYTFTVTAANGAGTGAASSASNTVTPVGPVTVPGAPTGVVAVPGTTSAVVRWSAPASGGGAAISGYTVRSSPGDRTCTATTVLRCTVSGLTNGTAYAFTVTATNSAGTGPASSPSALVTPAFTPNGSGFTAMSPVRVLDTRTGVGAPVAKVGAGGTVNLTIPGLPDGATAVVMNVTATRPTATSYVSVYRGGTVRTGASNLNVVAGQTVPNLVTVGLGVGHQVTLYNAAGTIDLIADLAGYYTRGAGAGFTAVSPKRVLDTRTGVGAPVAKVGAGGTVSVTIPGLPDGATAVTMNVTATRTTATSYVSVYPGGTVRAGASNLNVVAGQTVPNLVTVGLGVGHQVTLYNAAGTIDLIADLAGYYTRDAGAGFTALPGMRVLDTRTGVEAPVAKVGAGGTVSVMIRGLPDEATAVVMNVTATRPTATSYVSVYPGGTTRPGASNLNVVAGQTVPNLVTVGLGAGHQVTLYNNAGTIDLIADVVGYFTE